MVRDPVMAPARGLTARALTVQARMARGLTARALMARALTVQARMVRVLTGRVLAAPVTMARGWTARASKGPMGLFALEA